VKILVVKETAAEEVRAAVLPADAARLVRLGAALEVEDGMGESIGISNSEYERAGAVVSKDRRGSLAGADLVLRIGVPDLPDLAVLREGSIHISLMDPFGQEAAVRELARRKVSGISLEMIPRTTLAQKMDVLSSQANLAGYAAAVLAAERLAKSFPMMMTPAGTIAPARVFVLGAGVAGLQAIATAKRLGARVDAFDIRPEAQEQIASLGAKPLLVDLGATMQTKDGYAGSLSEEQLGRQREAMSRQCAQSDVVIATARVFGKPAPILVTQAMQEGMKPGSVIVDLAVEAGGNVEGVEAGKEIVRNGVRIIGIPELSRRVPVTASQMFSSNLYHFVEHFWDKQTGGFSLRREDEILRGCLVTHGGEIVNERIRERFR